MTHTGSCHCGNVKFEVEGTLDNVMECNCSICLRQGALRWFTPREKLKLLTPEANLSTYTFNKHAIQHHFCATCGCVPYGEGVNPKTGTAMAAINARCIEGVDIAALKITKFDGRNL
ncbi:MAG: GFA family protein [Burkholderiales bacterium]